MTSLYYADDSITLHAGNNLAVLPTLPAGSVDCIVTSPPYFGLRDYDDPDQHGLEGSPAEYVQTMRDVFAASSWKPRLPDPRWSSAGQELVCNR